MGRYRYRSLASEFAVVATGVAALQARHFRTALGSKNQELAKAVRSAIRVVLESGTELVAAPVAGHAEWLRTEILDEARPRGRFDVQIELEISKRFGLRTDRMARRCVELARIALRASPGSPTRLFLSWVGRCYVAGLFPESVVMCRAVLEQAVQEKFARERQPLPKPTGKSEMGARLARAEDLGWISRRQRTAAWSVYQRGNKAIHADPHLTNDILGTITTTLALLETLYSGEQPRAAESTNG